MGRTHTSYSNNLFISILCSGVIKAIFHILLPFHMYIKYVGENLVFCLFQITSRHFIIFRFKIIIPFIIGGRVYIAFRENNSTSLLVVDFNFTFIKKLLGNQ